MPNRIRKAGGALALLIFLVARGAMAGPQDYMFEVAELEVPTGNATLTVRLIDMSSENAVPDAVIVENKVEMTVSGRTPIVAAVTPARADGQGGYRFDAQLPIAGDWIVHLAAKVRGEPQIVRGEVKVTAMP